MKKFFQELLKQFLAHGKMLVGYLLLANPWLSDFPTLLAALQLFLAAPTKENLVVAIGQAILALGASHRIVKILRGVLKNM